jgi:hypothetical protein
MVTKAELVTIFRKEAEDLMRANDRNTHKAQYGTKTLEVGANYIILEADTDPASDVITSYETPEEYEIRFHKAIDSEGIDIKEALTITDKTSAGFTVTSGFIGELEWETFLKYPNFNFWT